MLTKDFVKQRLEQFAQGVESDAKTAFRPHSVTGKGSRSITHEVNIYPKSIGLEFEMADYMEYQDKGVSGIRTRYNTPYSYRDKMPPPSAFDRWSVRRALEGTRNAQGRFIKRKTINYALARHIYLHGIRPKKFFTTAFDQRFRQLPDELVEAYGLEAERLMETSLNATKK